ncbi:MAG: FtsQ-type POTRA domain-containing protein [Chloroflexota bacterium]|nr:FtsQ-type POTRA domain-containing protein [Chloroflexota bacterium]
MTARRAASRRRGAAHARRPGPPLRHRLRGSLPAVGRILALVAFAGLVVGLVLLVNGPWLRVRETVWAGERYTSDGQIERVLASVTGAPLLAIDSGALSSRLAELPAVASASVETFLPDRVAVAIVEKTAAVVWTTSAVALICAADGTAIGQLARGAALPDDLAGLPQVDDRRTASRNIIVGDRIEASRFVTAVHLAALDPATMGSAATRLSVLLDDESGFTLAARSQGWSAVFGLYEPDLTADPALLDQRIADQVAAIRTLFGAETEGGVSWIDARDPGRVYWRP